MTKEQITKWVGRIFILLLAVTIVVMVFGPDGKKALARHKVSASQAAITKGETNSKVVHFNPLDGFKDGQIAAILDEASKKRGSLVVGIVHCHVPGNPESEQLADSLNAVAKKYGSQVRVIRVDIVAFPAFAKAENVTNPPKVVMIVGPARVFEFQGLWPRPQIERKVDEILHGLERVGKDWRPEVKGMQRASSAKPPSLPKPAQP
jgi:hypothetical protein